MNINELQVERQKQLYSVLHDVELGLLTDLQADLLKHDYSVVELDNDLEKSFTFFKTDLEYITTLLSVKMGETQLPVKPERTKEQIERFKEFPTEVLKEILVNFEHGFYQIKQVNGHVVNATKEDWNDILFELRSRESC